MPCIQTLDGFNEGWIKFGLNADDMPSGRRYQQSDIERR
jgi:hypothetical protein